MRAPTSIFWANLTPFSLQELADLFATLDADDSGELDVTEFEAFLDECHPSLSLPILVLYGESHL